MTFIWEKLGQIFDVNRMLPSVEEKAGFAQSPQAVVLRDRVRVYFSTRLKDKGGDKFVSHVAWVDFSKDFTQVLGESQKEVVPLGELGCFDEHGIFPFSPFCDRGDMSGYSCGWSRRVSVSVETATGFVTSHDGGETYEKFGAGPVFANDLKEPCLVGDSFVRYFNGQYHMWYMFGERWVRESEDADPDRVYKIGHAVSKDGINWVRDYRQIIDDKLHRDECQALPSVTYLDGLYHMVFCYRDVFGFRSDPTRSYKIGYAVSKDCLQWIRCDDDLSLPSSEEGQWDETMMCYPHFRFVEGQLYLLYNGNKFGKEGFGAARLLQETGKVYTQNESRVWNIVGHFDSVDPDFRENLFRRVDREDYIDKLMKKSCRYECWESGQLVGLLAVYFNEEEDNPFIFISNISVVDSCLGAGVANSLLSNLIGYARTSKFHKIVLEVQSANKRAVNLYRKFGFTETNSLDGLSRYCLDF